MRPLFNALLLALPLAFSSLASAADSPAGRWQTIDDETGKPKSIVEIQQAADGSLTGKVVEILQSDHGPNPLCTECEGERKDQPITGMTILWDPRRTASRSGATAPSSTRPRARPTAPGQVAGWRQQAGGTRLHRHRGAGSQPDLCASNATVAPAGHAAGQASSTG